MYYSTINVSVKRELKDKLAYICRERNVPMKRFVEDILENFVKENEEKKEIENEAVKIENEKKEELANIERTEFIKRHISEYKEEKREGKDLSFPINSEDIISSNDLKE